MIQHILSCRFTTMSIILLLLVLFPVGLYAAGQEYCKMYQSPFPNPHRFNQVAFSDNLDLVTIYGPTSKVAEVYNSLSWIAWNFTVQTNFAQAPAYLEFYAEEEFPHNNIYMTEQGQVRVKTVIRRFDEVHDYPVLQLNCSNPDSRKKVVGQRRSFWAYCQGQMVATLADTAFPFDPIKWFHPQYPIKQLVWKEAGQEAFFACGAEDNNGQNRYLFQFGWRSLKDWTQVTEGPVVAMAYSANDSLLYFAEQKTGDEQVIWKLDLGSGEKSQFVRLVGQSQLTHLAAKFDLLSARTPGFEHIWRRNDSYSLGAYESAMEGSGLHNYGSYLVTVVPSDPSKFQVRYRCPKFDNEGRNRSD